MGTSALHNQPAGTTSQGLCRLSRRYGMFTFDNERFLAQYGAQYPATQPDAVANLSNLLDMMAEDPNLTDIRWAAYMLATVKHECADTFRPIEEFGKGRGRPYGEPVTVT